MSVIVIDANTVVSAALTPNGTARRAIAAARIWGTIALSNAVIQEIQQVLSRPKFARSLTEERRRDVLELLTVAAMWTEPAEPVQDCRDPKDNRYLELALAAQADTIISGDKDLTTLHPWRGIQILSAADFLAMITRN